MSSKTKKKTPSETATPPPKKIKLPKAFIVRPGSSSHKTAMTIQINSEILQALELTNGQFVYVTKAESGLPGVVATIIASAGIIDTNVVTVSLSLRSLAGLLLGDRVQIAPYTQQPPYTKSISVQIDETELTGTVSTEISNVLDKVGVLHPGLLLTIGVEGVEKKVTIIDINDDLLSALSSLDINDNVSISTVSPPFIFHPKTIINSTDSQVKYNFPQMPDYTQMGGLSKQIEVLKSSIELPLHNPELFSSFGISPPRGILLHGPPGTGKTMLLRCVAAQTNAHILSINGPSIVSKYLGETENAIRDIFVEARKFQPSIIFMDEVDSLVPNRNSDDSGESESRVVATLLTMMDSIGDSSKIVIVGSTNRPNSIDPALRRPGRFDHEVEIGIPDVDARAEILRCQFNKMNSAKHCLTNQDIASVAAKTHGYVGADLTALCREGVMRAIKRGLASGIPQDQLVLTVEDIVEALPEIRPSAMREIFLEMPKVYWSDIGGQHELKQKLVEVVQLPLEAAESFKNLGVSAPKGVLLYGPPGCSKTLTAKALATESGLNFLAVKGPEIFNKYVGESERTIREIFRKARAAAPSIIFFDEIDAISSDRDGGGTSASQHVLTSLLNEIDGVEELKGVVIVAATNRPTEIDPALLRPGRLDRHIYVAPPDFEARLQIITNGTKKFNLDSDVDLDRLATLTEGCSGAEVALLCQEAGLAAIMEDKNTTRVEDKHFDHALSGISRGITKDMLEYYEEFRGRSGIQRA